MLISHVFLETVPPCHVPALLLLKSPYQYRWCCAPIRSCQHLGERANINLWKYGTHICHLAFAPKHWQDRIEITRLRVNRKVTKAPKEQRACYSQSSGKELSGMSTCVKFITRPLSKQNSLQFKNQHQNRKTKKEKKQLTLFRHQNCKTENTTKAKSYTTHTKIKNEENHAWTTHTKTLTTITLTSIQPCTSNQNQNHSPTQQCCTTATTTCTATWKASLLDFKYDHHRRNSVRTKSSSETKAETSPKGTPEVESFHAREPTQKHAIRGAELGVKCKTPRTRDPHRGKP